MKSKISTFVIILIIIAITYAVFETNGITRFNQPSLTESEVAFIEKIKERLQEVDSTAPVSEFIDDDWTSVCVARGISYLDIRRPNSFFPNGAEIISESNPIITDNYGMSALVFRYGRNHQEASARILRSISSEMTFSGPADECINRSEAQLKVRWNERLRPSGDAKVPSRASNFLSVELVKKENIE